MLFFWCFLPESIEEEAQRSEADDADELSDEWAEVQEVEREIALEKQTEEEGYKTQEVNHDKHSDANESNECCFL